MSNDAKIFHLSFFDLIFYRPYHTNTLFSNTRRPNQLVGPFLVYLLTQCRFNHWLIGSTHNWVNQTRVNLRDSWNPLGSRFNPFCAKPIRSIQLVHEHAHTHTTGFARDQREFTQKKKNDNRVSRHIRRWRENILIDNLRSQTLRWSHIKQNYGSPQAINFTPDVICLEL